MSSPKGREIDPFEIAETRERNPDQSQQTPRQHSCGSPFHGHSPPPRAHKQERKIARGRNRKSLPDHEIDLERFNLHPQDYRYHSNKNRAPFEHSHAVLRSGFWPEDAAINIVRQRSSHGDQQTAKGAHEG